MKVLHLVETFSALSETFIYDYITELERQGVDNHVLTFNRVNETDRTFDKVHLAKIKKDIGWFILRVIAEFNNKPNKFWAMQRREIKKIVKKVRPDIIHAHFGPIGVIVAPVAKKLKIPLVVSFYGYDISVLVRQKFWIKNYTTLFNIGRIFIGMSQHICERLNNIGCPENKIIKFAAGIKIENFIYRDTVINKNDEIKLIHVGRLVEKKSPLLLIKAFEIVDKHYRQRLKLKLTIIGDGPLKIDAYNLVKELGLDEKIEFLGAVPHEKIKEHLFNSHIYTQHCVTAKDGDQEGLGVSFLEASATGLPIVTTKHNGIPDAVINGQTGYLVDEGDYENMAKKIIQLIQNPHLAKTFGIKGREHIEKNYDLFKQIKKIKEIFNTL